MVGNNRFMMMPANMTIVIETLPQTNGKSMCLD